MTKYLIETVVDLGGGLGHHSGEHVWVRTIHDVALEIVKFKMQGWSRIVVYGPEVDALGMRIKVYDDGCVYKLIVQGVLQERVIEPLNRLGAV